jgi:hypothetical protein
MKYKVVEEVDGIKKESKIHETFEMAKKALDSYITFFSKVLNADVKEINPNKYEIVWKENHIIVELLEIENE